MRCPKCGYISFDHLEVCLKCKKNIKAVSDGLRGTVFQVQAPAFLQLQPRQEDDGAGDILVARARAGGHEEYVDDDLEILIEEPQDKEIAFDEDEEELKPETEKVTADEEEDREIEIDFSQFEDAPDEEPSRAEEEPAEVGGEEKSFSLEMPEALADISDLAPPARMPEAEEAPAAVAQNSSAELDLDELDFNLELDDLDLPPAPGARAETELSLDDLDFSDTLAQSPPKPVAKAGADMDEELNFELDLGGLSIHKEQ